MPSPPQLAALLAALNVKGRVVTSAEIVDRFGQTTFSSGRADSRIVRILPGLYTHRDHESDLSTRLVAISRWLRDDEAISGLAACHIHGLEVGAVPRIAVVLRGKRHPRVPSWIRTRKLAEAIPSVTIDGVRIVALECALIDEVWASGLQAVLGLIIDAIREGKTDASKILDSLRFFQRIAHRRELVRFLMTLKDGVHSYLEYLADKSVFKVPDLQGLERQVEFVVANKAYRVDAYDRETKTAIELDSRKHHGSEAARRRDMERDAALASIGIQTLRFTYEQIRDRPLWCRRIIRDTIAARNSAR